MAKPQPVTGVRREPMDILGHQAHCSCGWASLIYQSGAQARAVETQHNEDHERTARRIP